MSYKSLYNSSEMSRTNGEYLRMNHRHFSNNWLHEGPYGTFIDLFVYQIAFQQAHKLKCEGITFGILKRDRNDKSNLTFEKWS